MHYEFQKTITSDIVRDFANVSEDKNPIHLYEEYGKRSIFKDKIVHGMLIGSFFSKSIALDLPESGSIYLNQ